RPMRVVRLRTEGRLNGAASKPGRACSRRGADAPPPCRALRSISKGETMTTVATASDTQVARPLRVLVPLIKEELDAGYHAGLEHYRRAGALLIEAKSQLQHGEWRAWLKRNFVLSHETARRYMNLARENQNARSRASFRPRTLSEAVGDFRKYPERSGALGASGKDV